MVGRTGTLVSGIAINKLVQVAFRTEAQDPLVTTVKVGKRTAASPVFGPQLPEEPDTEWDEAYIRAERLATALWDETQGFSIPGGQVQEQHWFDFDVAWDAWL